MRIFIYFFSSFLVGAIVGAWIFIGLALASWKRRLFNFLRAKQVAAESVRLTLARSATPAEIAAVVEAPGVLRLCRDLATEFLSSGR